MARLAAQLRYQTLFDELRVVLHQVGDHERLPIRTRKTSKRRAVGGADRGPDLVRSGRPAEISLGAVKRAENITTI